MSKKDVSSGFKVDVKWLRSGTPPHPDAGVEPQHAPFADNNSEAITARTMRNFAYELWAAFNAISDLGGVPGPAGPAGPPGVVNLLPATQEPVPGVTPGKPGDVIIFDGPNPTDPTIMWGYVEGKGWTKLATLPAGSKGDPGPGVRVTVSNSHLYYTHAAMPFDPKNIGPDMATQWVDGGLVEAPPPTFTAQATALGPTATPTATVTKDATAANAWDLAFGIPGPNKITAATTAPRSPSPQTGDVWIELPGLVLHHYDGTNWVPDAVASARLYLADGKGEFKPGHLYALLPSVAKPSTPPKLSDYQELGQVVPSLTAQAKAEGDDPTKAHVTATQTGVKVDLAFDLPRARMVWTHTQPWTTTPPTGTITAEPAMDSLAGVTIPSPHAAAEGDLLIVERTSAPVKTSATEYGMTGTATFVYRYNGSAWADEHRLDVQGPPGLQGMAGSQGPIGPAVTIKGNLEYGTVGNPLPLPTLPALTNAPADRGNAYIIIGTPPAAGQPGALPPMATGLTPDDGDLIYWDGSAWHNAGQIVGPQGPSGPQGNQGLQGDRGARGPQGPIGPLPTFGTQEASALAAGSTPTVAIKAGTDGSAASPLVLQFGIPNANPVWIVRGTNGHLYWAQAATQPKVDATMSGWSDLGDTTGPQGHKGLDGTALLSGVVDPTTDGKDGDFYVNTATNTVFGPKTAGAWPATGTSIVGPQGAKGDSTFFYIGNGVDGVAGQVYTFVGAAKPANPSGSAPVVLNGWTDTGTNIKGADGTSVRLLGSVDATAVAPTPASAGDLYTIVTSVPPWAPAGSAVGDGLVSDGKGGWSNVGPIRGPQGPAGRTGPKGDSAWAVVGDGTNGTLGHLYVATGTAAPTVDAAMAGWTDRGAIVGPRGADASIHVMLGTAAAGQAGHLYYSTATAAPANPAAGAVANTDPATGWVDLGDLTGPRGPKGDTPAVLNATTVGTATDGDLFLSVGTGPDGATADTPGDLYRRVGGAWQLVANLRGSTGPAGTDGLTPRITVDGDNLYYTFSTALGAVAPATIGTDAKTTWVDVGAVVGPQGPQGPVGPQPAFDTPTVNTVAAGGAATIKMTGAGTVASPFLLEFGVPRGADGTSIAVRGTVADWAALPAGALAGDLWIVSSATGAPARPDGTPAQPGDGAVSDGAGKWTNIGPLRGPAGAIHVYVGQHGDAIGKLFTSTNPLAPGTAGDTGTGPGQTAALVTAGWTDQGSIRGTGVEYVTGLTFPPGGPMPTYTPSNPTMGTGIAMVGSLILMANAGQPWTQIADLKGQPGADGVGVTITSGPTPPPATNTGATPVIYLQVPATGAPTLFTADPNGPFSAGVTLQAKDGAKGADGTDGHTLLGGARLPAATDGADGDWWIDTAGGRLYGPKTGGVWATGATDGLPLLQPRLQLQSTIAAIAGAPTVALSGDGSAATPYLLTFTMPDLDLTGVFTENDGTMKVAATLTGDPATGYTLTMTLPSDVWVQNADPAGAANQGDVWIKPVDPAAARVPAAAVWA